MLRRQVFVMFAALLLAAGLVIGLGKLFALRMEHGDSYPPYSTLRTDPLGAKAVYEALQEQPALAVSRNYRDLPRLHPDGPVTLIYAGVAAHSRWGDEELQVFDSMVSAGSRAVFTFLPEREYSKSASFAREDEKDDKDKDKDKNSKDEGQKSKSDKSGNDKSKDGKAAKDKATDKAGEPANDKVEPSKDKTVAPASDKAVQPKDAKKKKEKSSDKDKTKQIDLERPEGKYFSAVAKMWGFRFEVVRGDGKDSFKDTAILEHSDVGLEPEMSWHSALYFTELKPAWKVLYSCGKNPVVIERSWGRGSIVLVADSYFLSNEALRSERAPKLTASLIGPKQVIFDEQHHGVNEQPNMAGLVQKYRLQGGMAAILLVAGLFVWQHVVRFVPAYGTEFSEHGDAVAGQGATEGFVNLLRRTIAPSAILGACVTEWRKTFGQKADDVTKLEAALARSDTKNPVATYSAIVDSLRPTSSKPTNSKHP
jgi:hypothetical protein